MTDLAGRTAHVAAVLESATVLGRTIGAGHHVPLGDHDLTRSQLQALFTVAHDRRPVTPSRLVAVLGLTAGAVTQLVDRLRSAGLVETAPNPDDARSRIIRLTADAADEVDRFEHAIVERLLPRFDALDDHELHTLADLLERVTEEP
ncbi:MarR family winged helix-turn-helix transcriptional regulator [Agromyces sp. GXS1127]|uniref:MarR family winged helix-turn-helix transcriptional regulator n=1 Tax=Agromyces sp. GXS1127 TaxID=3424181 RepID=UPI003D310FF1